MIRLLDITFASIAILLLSPIFVVVGIILKFTGEGEIFFFQKRVGKNGEKFNVYKFATMLKDSPNMGSGTITSKNDPRILPVGKFLRKTKINELPQILNIIKGEMSFIGPRPHSINDLEGLNVDLLNKILEIKPGLSGIGSIVFRHEENILQTFENPRPFYDAVIAPYKAKLELYYCENISVGIYLKLIMLTLICLLGPSSRFLFVTYPDLPEIPFELKPFLK